ncbi:ATP-binding cassette domain-containing protein [Lactobacillus sp. S2-2]|uniref:amino acid ABC transporter ATP-binding protein n=1 Tax=Lactobacillus sp. S2-2 TaxID=2692917 RepID=UPI001F1A88B4|nr:amino acid ABC transporter ATP-binding protein [Lactobacillus sp. S2-2]MCF6515603.1 ATP-binding cassette domain-containing protein [Lactobacillus sp. S2-2]
MTNQLLKIENLTKKYKEVPVLNQINAEVNSGDVITLIGPSGAGKSTLLRCLNLLEKPTDGIVSFDGENIISYHDNQLDQIRTEMGMVFQQFNLFPHLTVLENIKLAPMKVKNKSEDEASNKAYELLKMVGLSDKANVYPKSLSGGQAQRIAIARALAMEPKLMLFDEPTSALDPEMVGEVLQVMNQLADNGMTMIVVTHEMNFAKNVANQVWFMSDHQIEEKADPKEFFANPKTENAKKFLNNLLV